jgi:Tol biopolymer transport system component
MKSLSIFLPLSLDRTEKMSIRTGKPNHSVIKGGKRFAAFLMIAATIFVLLAATTAGSLQGAAALMRNRPQTPMAAASKLLTSKSANLSQPGQISFAERVTFQRAIEEVYWRHRIWPRENTDTKPSLAEVMPRAQLEKKVDNYLRKSQALEACSRQPLTAEQLQEEMERMARNTRQPAVLRELFDVLDNDPFVIAECLARPALAERLVEMSAKPLGACSERQAEQMILPRADYTLPAIASVLAPEAACTNNTWTSTSTTNAPSARNLHTAVWTGSEMIVWGGQTITELGNGGKYNPATDTWTATSNTNAPAARTRHTAVWTGTEMIVWGGQNATSGGAKNTGGRYNPATDSWIATSTTGVPTARSIHTAVWTGSEMIVWGGASINGIENTGGKYNPSADSWSATSPTSVGRWNHTAVWTGSEMIIWGGQSGNPANSRLNTGEKYNPGSGTWAATSTINVPTARAFHTAVWTGGEMIVWAGLDSSSNPLNTGGRYNPVGDVWTATSTTNAPSARAFNTAVFTGSEMIVWGGNAVNPFSYLATGGRYNPGSDSWSATNVSGTPLNRESHTAVWADGQMIVWGGNAQAGNQNTGGKYCAPNTLTGMNVTVQSSTGSARATFAQVTVAGNTTFTSINPPSSAGTPPPGYTILNNAPAYDITTTASFTSPITLCFTVNSINNAAMFARVRILHGEGGQLVDRTILPPDSPAPDFATRTVCARVNSLSPFVVALAPAAGKIVFHSTRDSNLRELYVMNSDGTNQTRLTTNTTVDQLPSFSGDGSKIVFSSNRDTFPFNEIYVMNADGSNQTRLTNNTVDDLSPSANSNASKIAFERNFQIFVMNGDGTGEMQLTSLGTNRNPSFSADGSKITFESTRDGGQREIYVMNAAGTNQTRLTNTSQCGGNFQPSFNPDGSKIVFVSACFGPFGIYVMNSDGTGLTPVINDDQHEATPTFSPDGTSIAFRDGEAPSGYEIYVINVDGTGKLRLTNNAAEDDHPSWGASITCSFSLSATRECFAASASTGSVNVTAPAGCNWTAMSNDGFITITSGSSGSGDSVVNYSVAANTASSPRTGTLTIAGQTFTLLQGGSFSDVAPDYPFYTFIGKLSARRITAGCGDGTTYCPDAPVTRAQMAAFIIRALGEFNPPPPAQQRFQDVPPTHPFYAFIDRMAVLGITLGCGDGSNYCPDAPITREQMAAFIIRALHEPGYVPPTPGAQRFADVPPTNPFYAHIEEMAVRGITLGCDASHYCPSSFVTRGQMAAFLIRAFGC